jgi:DNA-binding response OmpR family regulator
MKRTMKKILLADDDAVLCELYAEELMSEGYAVITARDGSGLMEVIRHNVPDLIVLDIRLGQYDGLDLLQDIRRLYYDMPVVLCSAYASFKWDLRSVAADYYVVKSGDLTELKKKIHRALEGTASVFAGERVNKAETQGHQRIPPSIFVG